MKPAASPPQDAADLRERLRGLAPPQAQMLRRAMRLVADGDRLMAGQLLYTLAQAAPDHPEVLRWCGLQHANQREWVAAAACLQRSLVQRPGDVAVWLQLSVVHNHAADFGAARDTLRAAVQHVSQQAQWLALSIEFDRQGHVEDALSAVDQALALEPGHALALLQRVRCLKAVGRAAAAAADCRALIAQGQYVAQAWFSLVDLKTVALQTTELAQLQRTASQAALSSEDRVLLDFALGKAQEDAGLHGQALATLTRANQGARSTHPWHAAAFTAEVDAVQVAFGLPGLQTAQPQGAEVIFLVGLPRSGTTLVEQVLASHSRVEGASELPYLQTVLDEESARRSLPFPGWVGRATAEDWTRLGHRYLHLSARWRAQRPVSTDKLPANWLLAGAALAMLPDARVVDCRRDALETCWSCFKQLFGPGQAGFSYSFDTLAAYWRDYQRLTSFWAARQPGRFRVQSYEALVAAPEIQIRALLDFCGLAFEPGCLRFHEAQRAIRTPSALQVRQPLQRTSTPAAGYGELLAPLRALLGSTGQPLTP
jgi:tetratricopeptide (TPR) repeat protein